MNYHWNIIGHQNQINRLEKDIKSNKISHAYLFSGPGKIGKFKIAKTFAKILQCPDSYSGRKL